MKMRVFLTALIIAIFSAGMLMAQEAPKAEAAEVVKVAPATADEPVKVGAVVFSDFTMDMIPAKDPVSGDDLDRAGKFNITRAYIIVGKKFNENFSAKMIADAAGYRTTGTATTLLKYAAIESCFPAGPLSIGANLGVIETPYTAYTAGRNGDYFINGDHMLARGSDGVYDLGLAVSVKYEKIASLYGTVTNGEGFKALDPATIDKNQAFGARLVISPLAPMGMGGLDIVGFYYNEKIASTGYKDDLVQGYIAGGVSWSDAMIKAGANFMTLAGEKESASSSNDDGVNDTFGKADVKGKMAELWVNFNLESFVNLPLYVPLNFCMNLDDDAAAVAMAGKGNIVYAGLGYKPVKGIDLVLLYQHNMPSEGDATSNMALRTQFVF